jgi:hypothetical protein
MAKSEQNKEAEWSSSLCYWEADAALALGSLDLKRLSFSVSILSRKNKRKKSEGRVGLAVALPQVDHGLMFVCWARHAPQPLMSAAAAAIASTRASSSSTHLTEPSFPLWVGAPVLSCPLACFPHDLYDSPQPLSWGKKSVEQSKTYNAGLPQWASSQAHRHAESSAFATLFQLNVASCTSLNGMQCAGWSHSKHEQWHQIVYAVHNMHGFLSIKKYPSQGALLLHQDAEQFTLTRKSKTKHKKEREKAFQARKELSSDVTKTLLFFLCYSRMVRLKTVQMFLSIVTKMYQQSCSLLNSHRNDLNMWGWVVHT